MYFEELISHLFNLKLLAYLDKYNLSVEEYLNQIKASAKLQTELNLKEQTDFDKKTTDSIIHKSGEVSFIVYEDETKNKIINLLKKGGIEDPIFGSIDLSLENLITTLNKGKHKKLKEYLFGKEWSNKKIPKLMTINDVLKRYIVLTSQSTSTSFITYYKLLEWVKSRLKRSLEESIKEVDDTAKNKNHEDKTEYLRALKNSLTLQINKASYIVVGEVSNHDYSKLTDLGKFLSFFSKTNNLSIDEIKKSKDQLIDYFKNVFFSSYIDKEYIDFVKEITLDDDEIFALIQNRNKLNLIVHPDNIDLFSDLEKQLIKEGFFNKKGKWNKEKLALVKFIVHCSEIRYFNISLHKPIHIRKFFEERYIVNITKQFQPKERKKAEKFPTSYTWIRKPN